MYYGDGMWMFFHLAVLKELLRWLFHLYVTTDRGDVPKGTTEIFFRKVKFWKEDGEEEAPPVFVGILFPLLPLPMEIVNNYMLHQLKVSSFVWDIFCTLDSRFIMIPRGNLKLILCLCFVYVSSRKSCVVVTFRRVNIWGTTFCDCFGCTSFSLIALVSGFPTTTNLVKAFVTLISVRTLANDTLYCWAVHSSS